MAHDYTDEELDDLTEEERRAIEAEDGDDTPDEETDTDAADAETAAGTDDDDRSAGTDKSGTDDKAGDAQTPGDGDEPEPAVEDEPGEETPPREAEQPAPPPLRAELPADYAEQVQAIETQKSALTDQFDDGELTAREYQQQLDALNRQERSLEQQQFKAQIAEEMAETAARNAWQATVKDFIGNHEQYQSSAMLFRELDRTVREIANSDEGAELSGRDILDRAHQRIQQELGQVVSPARGEPQDDPAAQTPAPGTKQLPPNLGKLPTSEMSEADNSQWASLDRLFDSDPEAYEDAVARLSEAEQDAYLSR